ncbi:hypothetical protein DE146DRAFT_626199 [Phaeosphaeria sp. MPI-PUGE-AT-0046c]|nr:hypothetical protein DE146DRAFT_626199 [Phaeosphaeria sp. MPI-PUGE-AT-0046c]
MSAPHGQNTHPRRRPIKAQGSPLSTHTMSLRKSGTFSSPKSLSTDICGLENHAYMPRRSPTSPESLEALINQESGSLRRVTDLLDAFDRKIAGHRAASAEGANILADPEVLPVPSFVLDSTTFDTDLMDLDPKPSAVEHSPHEHTSDSGLGSSIGGSKYGKPSLQLPIPVAPPSDILKDAVDAQRSSVRESINTSVTSAHSAVTRSCSAVGAPEQKHTLGEYACKQIHDSIIKPILAEEALKDFHPLIQDVPRRIGEKSICNLRDLEKTLIFLAPELSATATSYLRFCERSIQLLHATVEHLSDQDQRLPTDRAYSNNYFLDLVEQIRRYAAIMAATRQKESKGETLDDMDYSRDEKITLRGGLSHNGRPLEIVREKDGKVVSLVEGNDSAYKVSKRALSDDDMDEDEATRSMARRRKSDKPGDVMHTCRDCKKEFKRPCDLTKHEKTHSRPWKCSEEKCKYFEFGWPTEKERDRHMNDKHSAAPAQYKCLYPPCTYASKRESNCKQHMEKAHGWEYVRSKSNGRKKAPSNDDRSPTTPLTPFLGTPLSATLTTPVTPFAPSPQVPMIDAFDYYGFGTPSLSVQGFQDDFRRDSVTTNGSHFTFSSGHSPIEPTSFDDAVTPEDTAINHNDIFNNCGMGNGFTNAFQQQPTPALSMGGFDFDLPFTTANMSNGLPHLSPMAQPDVTLFSPQMHMDEGYGDLDMQAFSRPTEDFTLFDTVQPSNMTMNSTANFFPDFNQVGGQFDSLYAEPTTTLDDLMGNFGAQ